MIYKKYLIIYAKKRELCTWKFISLTIVVSLNNAKNILKELAYINLNSIRRSNLNTIFSIIAEDLSNHKMLENVANKIHFSFRYSKKTNY